MFMYIFALTSETPANMKRLIKSFRLQQRFTFVYQTKSIVANSVR